MLKKPLWEKIFNLKDIFQHTLKLQQKSSFFGGNHAVFLLSRTLAGNSKRRRSTISDSCDSFGAIRVLTFLRPHPQKFCGEWLFSKEYQTHFSNLYKKYFHSIGETPRVISSKFLFHKKRTFGPFFETIESIGNLDEIWVLWRNQSQNFPSDPPGWCRARQVLQP